MFQFKTNVTPATQFKPNYFSTEKVIQSILNVDKIEACSQQDIIPTKIPNSFVGSALLAYDQHLGFSLRPDDVWITILQGISRHVERNAERFRHFFVKHEGKKEIIVQRNHFVKGDPSNDWTSVFEEFCDKISKNANHVESMVSDFSTTDQLSKTVSHVTIMDTLKSYFKYTVMTSCGIPEYRLEGNPSDWKEIFNRAHFFLDELGFSNWKNRLLPVLEEFCNASEGNPNMKFWDEFVKEINGSGGSIVSGNIVGLIPYSYSRNTYILLEKNGINSQDIPCSLTSTPFKWVYLGQNFPMKLVAGIAGATVSCKDTFIRPALSWAILEE